VIELLNLVNIQYCYEYLVSQISLGLLVYSHIPTAIIALVFGAFLFFKTRKLSSGYLFLLCVTFALWCFFDIAAWFAFLGSHVTMFTWSVLDVLSTLFFFLSYCFLYTFVKDRDLPIWQKIVSIGLITPVAIWSLLSRNISSFDLNICEAVENELVSSRTSYIQLIFLLSIIGFIFYEYVRSKNKSEKSKVVLAGVGVTLFLFTFFFAAFLADVFINFNIWQYAYNVEIYGLFGMPVMLIYLGYLIVRYKAFDLKIFAAQALAITTIVIVAAQYAFLHDAANIILNSINLVFVTTVGIYLMKNVKREIVAREKIEVQKKQMEIINVKLEEANVRLQELDKQKTEFISFASHQLRSPLTAVKGYASLILEGDYGQISDDLKKAAQIIFDSTKTLAVVVDDYLNVSRIELGQMKYDITSFDFKKLIQDVVDELKPNVEKAGLELKFNVDSAGTYEIKGDKEKLKQVITNVIDNSVKYTPKGNVTIDLGSTSGAIKLSIKDTGIGIAKDVIPRLFSKFSRASNANKTNIRGTGLGLFIAKEILTAHKGKIWVESEGDGKGSQFYIEIPRSA
jgi:signal transduction histidine kinase